VPRNRKPGPRQNRTDLPPVAAPGGPTQPQRNFTGAAYGERARNAALQGAVALPDRSPEAMMSSGGGAPAPMEAQAQDPMAAFVAAAQAAQSPGQGLLTADSARPAEPVTAGLDVGTGPGSGSLPPLATTGQDPSIALWARWLPALGLLASSPGSSPQVRQYYRRLRSQLPADYYATTET